ncbi:MULTISPECIES: hypothetical protein [Streptomyces]|uniref:Uncharacterized protein n=1 Tax=Streptomyces chartreusis NRRL 3882 TaxID=1079985 RepID=A0A2N9B985_STRCX|nr:MULTISPECIES: hypothetical protein [Streptomyces]MYS94999.1 hypothetical protein [Streptomyces sp. SID5464]SOR79892.1 hypothetical protein SCNRRL3882_3351 [Streptomyces chartreusis NRRL 3882]
MPSYDSTRGRFRLAESHLAVFGHRIEGEEVPQELAEAERELREAGLTDRVGNLDLALSPLVSTLRAPTVVLHVEALGEHGTLHHGVTIGDGYVYSHESWPGSAESEYVRLEPNMLVWALARMINLQGEDTVDVATPEVEATMAVLDAGLATLDSFHGLTAEEGIDRIAEALKGAGLTRKSQLSTLAKLIAGMRSSWRMTAAWQGHDEGTSALQVRGFAVWDCGPLGYWHRELPAEPVLPGQVDDTTPLRLVRVDAKEVWQLITNLLPDGEEFATAPHSE